MRILLLILTTFLIFLHAANAQTDTAQSKEALTLLTNANAMSAYFKSGEYKKFITYVHPAIVRAVGGEAKMMEVLKKVDGDMAAQELKVNSVEYEQPSEIIKAGNSLQTTIAQHTTMTNPTMKVITHTTFIAVSTDQGKSWKFVDTNHKTLENLQKVIPMLSNKLVIPETRKPTVTRL